MRADELTAEFGAGDADAVGRVRRVLPGRTEPIGRTEARYVLARENGCDSWHELATRLLEEDRGLEWSARAAQKLIADNDVKRLRKLLKKEPALLQWRDPDADGAVLLQATTSYANFPGADEEETWNRPECAEVLLDAGALVDPRVPLRMIDTGAHRMLATFEARGKLPSNLRVFAALGDLERVRASFDANGRLDASALPSPELRTGHDGAAREWPDPANEDAVVADAFLYACRLARREVAAFLLERCRERDADLATRIDGWNGSAAFLEFLFEHTPEGARFGLERGEPGDGPGLVWQTAVELRLHAALHAREPETVSALLVSEPFFGSEACARRQVRFLEVASYSDGALPVIDAFLAAAPSILDDAPPSRAISYALEYGHADYVPTLTRVWPLPDDLPHAAGLGDGERVAAFFGADGRPALGDPARHNPFPDQAPLVSVQDVVDRALAWSVQNGEYETADFLLDHGADIDTRWGTHEPAGILHECAAAGRMEQVRYLVRRGIDVGRTDDRFGATAAEWAEFGGHDEVAAYLGGLS